MRSLCASKLTPSCACMSVLTRTYPITRRTRSCCKVASWCRFVVRFVAVSLSLAQQQGQKIRSCAGCSQHRLSERGDGMLVEAGEVDELGFGQCSRQVRPLIFTGAGDDQQRSESGLPR